MKEKYWEGIWLLELVIRWNGLRWINLQSCWSVLRTKLSLRSKMKVQRVTQWMRVTGGFSGNTHLLPLPCTTHKSSCSGSWGRVRDSNIGGRNTCNKSLDWLDWVSELRHSVSEECEICQLLPWPQTSHSWICFSCSSWLLNSKLSFQRNTVLSYFIGSKKWKSVSWSVSVEVILLLLNIKLMWCGIIEFMQHLVSSSPFFH